MSENYKFYVWVHEITVLGYEENIVIPTEHSEHIVGMFDRGLTPKEALDEYINHVI